MHLDGDGPERLPAHPSISTPHTWRRALVALDPALRPVGAGRLLKILTILAIVAAVGVRWGLGPERTRSGGLDEALPIIPPPAEAPATFNALPDVAIMPSPAGWHATTTAAGPGVQLTAKSPAPESGTGGPVAGSPPTRLSATGAPTPTSPTAKASTSTSPTAAPWTAAPWTAAPSTSTSPTTASPTAAPSTGISSYWKCNMTYAYSNIYGYDFDLDITVTNTSPTVWNDWQGSFQLNPAVKVMNSWGGAHFSASGSYVAMTPAAGSTRVASGSSVSMGFHAFSSGFNVRLTDFMVNGSICHR